MHPRQMRETLSPVVPSRAYSIVSLSCGKRTSNETPSSIRRCAPGGGSEGCWLALGQTVERLTLAVLGRTVEVEYPKARARSDGSPAFVAGLKRGLARPKSPHHDCRQIMPVADASWIATRYDEQCRSAIDHKSSDVRNGSDAKLLVEREPKAHKRRHLTAKPRRIDLSL